MKSKQADLQEEQVKEEVKAQGSKVQEIGD